MQNYLMINTEENKVLISRETEKAMLLSRDGVSAWFPKSAMSVERTELVHTPDGRQIIEQNVMAFADFLFCNFDGQDTPEKITKSFIETGDRRFFLAMKNDDELRKIWAENAHKLTKGEINLIKEEWAKTRQNEYFGRFSVFATNYLLKK